MRIPKLRLHATGQFFVVIRKKTTYLGKKKDEAEKKYRELIASQFAVNPFHNFRTITVGQLLQDYVAQKIKEADPRWRKTRVHILHQATRHAIELYGRLPASAFGPLALQNVRQAMCSVFGTEIPNTKQDISQANIGNSEKCSAKLPNSRTPNRERSRNYVNGLIGILVARGADGL